MMKKMVLLALLAGVEAVRFAGDYVEDEEKENEDTMQSIREAEKMHGGKFDMDAKTMKKALAENNRLNFDETGGFDKAGKTWKSEFEYGASLVQMAPERNSFIEIGAYDAMNVEQLYIALSSTLKSALSSESKGDADAAVAKTAAIKNIQKALTARILKRLDDGQPLVEVARKMKAIEGMQPQINDMERRLGIMQSVEPVLENAIKTLQKVVDVRGMGKK